MRRTVLAVWAGMRAELLQLGRSPLLVALTVVQAITFLLLVSLFGLTGSRAPTALVDHDHSAAANRFIADLRADHHSFSLRTMNTPAAMAELRQGDLVAVITIPRGFSHTIQQGKTVALPVAVDNIDTDLTEDIQRALPAAIVTFALQSHLPNIHLRPAERDLLQHDTGFIPYLVVSALALDAFVVAGILAAVAVAREYESGAIRMLAVVPVHPLAPLAGRMLAASTVAFAAMLATTAIVVFGYGVVPVNPLEMIAALLVSVLIFSCLGVVLGCVLKRTLPVASLVFGLSLPLYIDSGSLEPERFDGNVIWTLAHLSPIYYVVGVLEDAAHGLRVTPEPIPLDFLALAGWGLLALGAAALAVRKGLAT